MYNMTTETDHAMTTKLEGKAVPLDNVQTSLSHEMTESTVLLSAQQERRLVRKIDIQYAIWSVFDPSAIDTLTVGSNDYKNAEAWLTAAEDQHYSPTEFSNVAIYTASPTGESQEFIVLTPEPSALALLAVDLCGVIGAVFFFIRRRRKVAS